MNINLSFVCKKVSVKPYYNMTTEVEIEKVDTSDVLNHFTPEQVIDHFGADELLELIGEKKVKEYFDLIERE